MNCTNQEIVLQQLDDNTRSSAVVPHNLLENTECAPRNNRIKHLINVVYCFRALLL